MLNIFYCKNGAIDKSPSMSKKMELAFKQLLILRCEYQIVWLDNVDVNAILLTQDSEFYFCLRMISFCS